MGNRAVITTKNGMLGIYLHWNGGRDSVEAFLKYCELRGFASPSRDCYGWARLCQVIGNFFGGGDSIGIDYVNSLDCDNGDNGVYIIDGWEIVGRKYFEGIEQNVYKIDEMMLDIDRKQPKEEQIGDFLRAKPVDPSELKIGDMVCKLDWKGKVVKAKIVGIGEDRYVNGHKVHGIPYIGLYGGEHPEDNPNNYLDSLYGKTNVRLITNDVSEND